MKFLIAVFCIILLCTNTYGAELNINAKSAVLMDAQSGRVLWARDCEAPMPMASTTKIMTAIVALEGCDIHSTTTVSKNAACAPPVKLHLSVGEHITVEQLLYAMLLQSSNDAAVAVAEAVSGDVEAFCALMNKKARQLGCSNTYFETPNGLDKGNHHSTAHDMAIISAYAIKNADFIKISNTQSYFFKTDKASYSLTNKDRLLREYSGAIGIKTGFTGKAGHCFAGAAKRGDITLISVVLASGWGSTGKEKKWSDTKQLLNYGFDNYTKKTIIEADDKIDKIEVQKAKVPSVPVAYADSFDTLVNGEDSIEIKKELQDGLIAPVSKGQRVGRARVFINSQEIFCTDLVTSEEAERIDFAFCITNVLKKWLGCCT